MASEAGRDNVRFFRFMMTDFFVRPFDCMQYPTSVRRTDRDTDGETIAHVCLVQV